MSGTYTVPPYANPKESYEVPIMIEDDPSTVYNNESFEQSYSTQRDSMGYTTSAGTGAGSGTEDSDVEGHHAGEVSEDFLYGGYHHSESLPTNPAGQPLAELVPAVSASTSPPGGTHSNLPLDPSSVRRAVRINPVPVSSAPRVLRRPSQSAVSGSRTLTSGPLQVPVSQYPAVTVQPTSQPTVITSGAIVPATSVASAQATVYLPLATGGMIPISLPASTLNQISNPTLVQPASVQVPSNFGVSTSASAIPAGGPPGGGYPYSSGSGPPGGGPPYSGGPPGGASSIWHPPPVSGNYPQYPVYPGSGGNVPGGFGGGGPGGPGGGGCGGPPHSQGPPYSAGQGQFPNVGIPGLPNINPTTGPSFSSHQKLTPKIELVKLNDTNWLTWTKQVYAMLWEMNVNYCVHDDYQGAYDDFKAQTIITQACTEQYSVQITDLTSAYHMCVTVSSYCCSHSFRL
eukprot:jgi/Botrbrau1/20680/Bobra.0058s0010.1